MTLNRSAALSNVSEKGQSTSFSIGGSFLGKAYGQFILFLNSIGTCAIFGLMVVINTDVFSRELFSMPINGVPEIVRLSIVGIVFLQAAHTVASKRMTHSDMMLKILDRKLPTVSVVMQIFFSLVGALLFTAICYGTKSHLVKSWINNDYIGSMGVFTAPIWPINAIIVLGAGLVALQYIIEIMGLIGHLLRTGKTTDVVS